MTPPQFIIPTVACIKFFIQLNSMQMSMHSGITIYPTIRSTRNEMQNGNTVKAPHLTAG